MPAEASKDLSGLDQYKHWKPEAQERALDLLKMRQDQGWKPFYCPDPECDGKAHGDWDFPHARKDQRPPRWRDDWLAWVLMGGRGSGKTRTGSEVTHRVSEFVPRMVLIAPTGPDFRDTMVEGMSGLLATAHPDKRPEWEPSKRRLTWPNGCVAEGFSAEEPDRLRGKNSAYAWADEPAHYPDPDAVWDMMLFGLRIPGKGGINPKVVATSTPKPTKWLKKLVANEDSIVHRVSTYANLENLAPTFRKAVLDRYEGTRIGRQELHGEVLEDVEGALWNWEMFRHTDVIPVDLTRIVVGVDPAGTANRRSDETGIIVVAIGTDKNIYVLGDYTGKYSPAGWAKKIEQAVIKHDAGSVVVEKTYGRDMVQHVFDSTLADLPARIIPVDSRRGKEIRAEPVVGLYEKERVIHAGDLQNLEDEQVTWVPGETPSPNRVDALVHAVTELGKFALPASFATPAQLPPESDPLGRRQGFYF